MTVTEILNDNLINHSELSKRIYGENKPSYIYRKINKKDGLSLKNKDFELIADFFSKNFQINLELI